MSKDSTVWPCARPCERSVAPDSAASGMLRRLGDCLKHYTLPHRQKELPGVERDGDQ